MHLAEFILQRIAEDEAVAQKVAQASPGAWAALPVGLDGLARYDTDRVLAECAAKRVAVDWYLNDDDTVMGPTVRALATVYDDHPDFQEAWRSGR